MIAPYLMPSIATGEHIERANAYLDTEEVRARALAYVHAPDRWTRYGSQSLACLWACWSILGWTTRSTKAPEV